MKIAISGVDSRVVVWVREFLLGRTQRVRLGAKLSEEIRLTAGVPQGSVSHFLFLTYLNDIWRNIVSTIRLLADDYVMYRKIINNENVENMQKKFWKRWGDRAAENAMKINASKSKAVRFARARVKDPVNYTLGGKLIPEASSSKYLGIILRSDLSWLIRSTTQ